MSVPPLTEALGIPGAHAVSLLDPDGSRVLWWAGETAPSEQEAAAAVTLAAASAGLVLLDGKGSDELGDILLTSADAFHVVRLVGAEAPLVAHLTLRRAGANLAMARREFGSLIAAYAKEVVRPRPALPTSTPDSLDSPDSPDSPDSLDSLDFDRAPRDPGLDLTPRNPDLDRAPRDPGLDLTPRDLGGGTVDLSASVAGPPGFRSAGFSPDFHPAEVGPSADLPRRHRADPSEPDESSADLLDLLGRPYVTDDDILDRVLVALRGL